MIETLRSAGLALLLIPLAAMGTAAEVEPLTPNTLRLAEGAARPAATLDAARLLVGHRRGPFLGGEMEEIWLPPDGGTMLGLFRLIRDGAASFYEIQAIVEEEGSIALKVKHFAADLTAWEEKDEMASFRFVKAAPDALWFEGLTFRALPDGGLEGFIALKDKDGAMREEAFRLRPINTATPDAAGGGR